MKTRAEVSVRGVRGCGSRSIAAVNGMACGGAFYLLGQVDFIVAAEHATFFDPHVTYGMPAVFEPALMGERMPFGEVMRMTPDGQSGAISADEGRADRSGDPGCSLRTSWSR